MHQTPEPFWRPPVVRIAGKDIVNLQSDSKRADLSIDLLPDFGLGNNSKYLGQWPPWIIDQVPLTLLVGEWSHRSLRSEEIMYIAEHDLAGDHVPREKVRGVCSAVPRGGRHCSSFTINALTEDNSSWLLLQGYTEALYYCRRLTGDILATYRSSFDI